MPSHFPPFLPFLFPSFQGTLSCKVKLVVLLLVVVSLYLIKQKGAKMCTSEVIDIQLVIFYPNPTDLT